MSTEQDQSRTEEATPRRRERARAEGQVVFSPDLSSGAMLLVVSIAFVLLSTNIAPITRGTFQQAWSDFTPKNWGLQETVLSGQWLLSHLIIVTSLLGVATTGVALLVTHLQSGFTFTSEPLTPKWEKLSLSAGWTRLISLESLFRGVLAVCKLVTSLAVIVLIVQWGLHSFRLEVSGTAATETFFARDTLLLLIVSLAMVTLLWGVVDYALRWWRHEQKLKMSRQEIKDEQKEDQGDPLIRSRIRRAQREAATRRTLTEVPNATMVITNPTHYAVALKYETGANSAPIVIAKGTDAFARRIAETAREHGVPVFERKPLTRAIYALADVGDEIPVEFYRAIAELLANIYRIRGQVA